MVTYIWAAFLFFFGPNYSSSVLSKRVIHNFGILLNETITVHKFTIYQKVFYNITEQSTNSKFHVVIILNNCYRFLLFLYFRKNTKSKNKSCGPSTGLETLSDLNMVVD